MPSRVFYAFPGNPASLGETIDQAISSLKLLPTVRGAGVRLRPWPEMQVTGENLVGTILGNIERSEVFACDLT